MGCLQKRPLLDSHLSTQDTSVVMSTFEDNCLVSEKRHGSSRAQDIRSILDDDICVSPC